MPQRQAVYAADWAGAERERVRVLPEGGAELAVKNLLRNCAWLDLDDNGIPVGLVSLIGPTTPFGWHVYDKYQGSSSRQTTGGPLPLSQPTFTPAEIVSSGITYLATGTAPSDAPQITSAPSVAAVDGLVALGLAAGWYGIALEWITASEAAGGLLTLPSTRDAVELTLGERIGVSDLPFLSEAPTGAYGIAVLCTSMQASEALALNATTALYVQQVYSLDALPTSCLISGPIRTDHAGTLSAGPDPTDLGSVPDDPVVSADASLSTDLAGNHKIRVSWAYPDGTEGAASPQASVTLSSDETYTVTKPTLGTGACEVLLNPVDRPAALAGVNHNQIRYTGRTGTSQDFRIFQLGPRAVVKAGETYTVSAYIKTASASQAKLFEMIFRDSNGDVIGSAAPIATLTGTNAWNRYSDDYTAPAGAVFFEVYGHEVGEGTITIAGLQIEDGSSATSFDDGTIPSGLSGYIIPAWETIPLENEHLLGGLPSDYSDASVEIDDSDGYDYAVSWASSDVSPADDPPSGWSFVSDIDDVVFRDYLAVKIEMEAP